MKLLILIAFLLVVAACSKKQHEKIDELVDDAVDLVEDIVDPNCPSSH